MQRFKQVLGIVVGLAVVGGLAAFVVYVLKAFFVYVSGVPKELGTALVAGASTVLVATVTIMVGRYFERKKELDVEFPGFSGHDHEAAWLPPRTDLD